MPDDLPPGAFTAALDRFDPRAEPFANMTPDRIKRVMADRLRGHDVTGYWEAELHLAEKTPPFDRYIHDLGMHVNAWLGIMDEQGRLPYRGWALRHTLAVWMAVQTWVRVHYTPETFPPLTPAESRKLADDTAIVMADEISKDTDVMERYQAELEPQMTTEDRETMDRLLGGDASDAG